MPVFGMVLPDVAVKGGSIVSWSATAVTCKPAVKLGLQRIDVPARELAADAGNRVITEMAMEQRQGIHFRCRPLKAAFRRGRVRGGRLLVRVEHLPPGHSQQRLASTIFIQGKREPGQVVCADDLGDLKLEPPVGALRS